MANQIIQVSDTQRIEVDTEGKRAKFVPVQYDGSFWCAFPSGQPRLSKSFKTEPEAREFLAAQPEFATIEAAWAALQALPSYCERDLSHE